MALLINVPYEEKDAAKSLGAKWNPELKKWFVQNYKDYHKFLNWLPKGTSMVLLNEFYLIEGKRQCFRCGKETPLIAVGLKDNLFFSDDCVYEMLNGNIAITGCFDFLPEKLKEFLNKEYNLHKGYSKTTGITDYANHCTHCGALQGNFFVFEEVDSPFYVTNEKEAAELKLYKVKLEYDLPFDSGIAYPEDIDLLKYCKVQELKY